MLIELWKLSRHETGPNLAKFNNSKRMKLKLEKKTMKVHLAIIWLLNPMLQIISNFYFTFVKAYA